MKIIKYISGAEYCPYDYIKIYDGKNSSSPEIGTFCGMGKFPHSIVGTSEDLFVEFVTSPAGICLYELISIFDCFDK